MVSKNRILLIEDDKSIASFIVTSLEGNGYRVAHALDGREGLNLASSLSPDVVLLDMGLPDIDGYDVLQALRTWCDVPIIIISARTQEDDKVAALDMGADDYISKPFGAAELMARIRTALRHNRAESPDRVYRAQGLEIHFAKRLILLDGAEVHLTQIEYQLLTLLAKNAGRVLTYNTIMNAIWGPYTDSNNQILRVNMANIRRKIEVNPAQPQYVFTEVGVGYRILEDENEGGSISG